MEPTDAFNWLMTQEWWKALTTMVTAAAIVTAVTPTKWDNIALKWIRLVLDVVAMNWGGAKNDKK